MRLRRSYVVTFALRVTVLLGLLLLLVEGAQGKAAGARAPAVLTAQVEAADASFISGTCDVPAPVPTPNQLYRCTSVICRRVKAWIAPSPTLLPTEAP